MYVLNNTTEISQKFIIITLCQLNEPPPDNISEWNFLLRHDFPHTKRKTQFIFNYE